MVILIQDLIQLLDGEGLNYSIINYPERNRKSIDIIIDFGHSSNKKLIVKTSNEKITKEEISDLKKFSSIIGGVPIIVTDETEEDIAIDKGHVVGLSLYGLSRIIKGDKIFVYRTRGGIFVKINPEVLKRKRSEMSLSMGDLANRLGVSRKTIYDYENGESDVSIEIAEKLIDIFGSDIIGNICESPTQLQNDMEIEGNSRHRELVEKLHDSGFMVASLKLTAIDVVAAKGNRKLVVTVEDKKPEKTTKKLREANKIASNFNLRMVIISMSSSHAKEFEKDGFEVYLGQNIDELVDEISRNIRRESEDSSSRSKRV
ncbi:MULTISPECIES: helix-turn-helix domain-containing protein [Acidianus]|uniref:Putative HTH-type transcriptional regulatory protein CM19_05375 n=1 Tax=Candidatus Acidianus copahuensis TaxID=1160895 RepID=A0A031LNZ7_9CREN|nr:MULTISPECIES: helix-turn-helix domain-containing protein [Acidianus]EZQ06807.1 transcriptional regulator [Candidatus Acidianus copahuensis]NON61818.1 helix-turn-helix domain-containing protein [Acidianus sp. RZ1]